MGSTTLLASLLPRLPCLTPTSFRTPQPPLPGGISLGALGNPFSLGYSPPSLHESCPKTHRVVRTSGPAGSPRAQGEDRELICNRRSKTPSPKVELRG